MALLWGKIDRWVRSNCKGWMTTYALKTSGWLRCAFQCACMEGASSLGCILSVKWAATSIRSSQHSTKKGKRTKQLHRGEVNGILYPVVKPDWWKIFIPLISLDVHHPSHPFRTSKKRKPTQGDETEKHKKACWCTQKRSLEKKPVRCQRFSSKDRGCQPGGWRMITPKSSRHQINLSIRRDVCASSFCLVQCYGFLLRRPIPVFPLPNISDKKSSGSGVTSHRKFFHRFAFYM